MKYGILQEQFQDDKWFDLKKWNMTSQRIYIV